MKKTATTLWVLLITSLSWAQTDYSKSLSGIDWVKISSKSDITVRVHDKNNILIKGTQRIANNERAKGLKLVGAGGTANTNVGFSVVKEGNSLIVTNLRKSESAEIFLPKNQKLSVTSTYNGDLSLNGFTNEVEATCTLNGGIKINGIKGPLTANTLNGEIEVVFDGISQKSPTTINTTNGAIDVSLAPNTAADIDISSWNGDMYSNFDIKSDTKEDMKKVGSRKTQGTINGGGVNITLKSINGNIYLRKKQ